MSDQISTFFDAWQLESSDARLEKITSAVIANVQYDDPRTPQTVNGIDALYFFRERFGPKLRPA